MDADYEALADDLHALAYPARLELLEILRFPHALGEIKLAARRSGPSDSAERVAARQTVQAHVDKLVDVDLVRVESGDEPGARGVTRYVLNRQRLYALAEEMLRLSVLRAGGPARADATGTLAGSTSPTPALGPRLVLVHGVYEGKSFPLDAASFADGRWAIGRKRGLPVSLDYDPWVSLEHAAIVPCGADFEVVDLGSKNGTTIGWVPLAPHGRQRLKPGDVVGVGRSLLVYAPE